MAASPTTSSATSNGNGISFTKSESDTIAIVGLFGTHTGVTGVFEATPDGTNWFSLAAQSVATNAVVSGTITLADTSANSFVLVAPMSSGIRFRITAITGGTLTSSHKASAFVAVPTIGGPTSGATLTSTTLTTPTLNGVVIIGDTSNPVAIKATARTIAQGAPTAETTVSTSLTAAKLLTGIITQTQTGAVTATLDTGTALDAAITYAANNDSIEWSLINIGSSSGAATVTAAAGHTIVGNAVVAISDTGRFRTRRTGANTWVSYRLA